MSWEQMSEDTKPCPCGKGTVTYSMDMDDWNRFRHSKVINCPACKTAADEKRHIEMEREAQRNALMSRASQIAEDRYLARWLAMFAGKTKKAAWQLYTGCSGYPALGTFYKHVKDDGGVEQYLRRSFSYDFQKALKLMNVNDAEIRELLAAINKIPESRKNDDRY